MKKGIYLCIALVMLLSILPVPTAAAPLEARETFLSVGDWNLDDDLGAIGIFFSAWDVNWRIPKAGTLEFGYRYFDGDLWQVVVEVNLQLNPKDYRYPQNLDLEAKTPHLIYPSNECAMTQFVRIVDREGAVVATETNGPYNYCFGTPP